MIFSSANMNRWDRARIVSKLSMLRELSHDDMTEDERQDLLGRVAEAHSSLSEVAFKLRRELTTKSPALKAAMKAERESFNLKRELQRLDIEEPQRRESLPEVRRGGKVVDVEELRGREARHGDS